MEIYYNTIMYNIEEPNLTRITLESGVRKVSWEMPHSDVDIYELIDAFYALLIGITWHPDTVKAAFENWVEEHTDNKSEDDE